MKMTIRLAAFAGLALMAACADTAIPDSAGGIDAPSGVGFGDIDGFAPLPSDEAVLPTGENGGLSASALANSGEEPLEASPGNPAPQVVTNAVGISDENDFDAVSEERDIAEDADLIAQNRAQYVVIEPTDVPVRPGTDMPNIVEYALQTTNPVGTQLYSRWGVRTEARHLRNCAEYRSPDLAQEAFLEMGGPERDRRNLDPDGDGFACSWNPGPFRAVRGG